MKNFFLVLVSFFIGSFAMEPMLVDQKSNSPLIVPKDVCTQIADNDAIGLHQVDPSAEIKYPLNSWTLTSAGYFNFLQLRQTKVSVESVIEETKKLFNPQLKAITYAKQKKKRTRKT